jgi:hypothetical protein
MSTVRARRQVKVDMKAANNKRLCSSCFAAFGKTERQDRLGANVYLDSPEFESRWGDRLSWLAFVVVFLSLSRKTLR